MLGSVVVAVLAIGGCDNGPPTFPPLDIDGGLECTDDVPCPDEGDVCLDGRCYQPCTSTCGPMEVCTRGVCMRGVPPDAGPVDVGPADAPRDAPPDSPPPDPCTMITCDGATPFCRAGVCLECEDSTSCGGMVPICDIAHGRCVGYAPGLCAPCNTALDCRGSGGTVFGDCVMRGGAGAPLEKVCLPTCADTSECPAGYRCDLGSGHCLPGGGASCTQVVAALASQPCTGDADCAPIGATVDTGLFAGSCQDTCLIPCGTGADCPASMTNCDGSIGGFCRP